MLLLTFRVDEKESQDYVLKQAKAALGSTEKRGNDFEIEFPGWGPSVTAHLESVEEQ